jgi:uncharacterized protein (DUF2342 family)
VLFRSIHVAGGIYKPDQDEGGHVVAGDREASWETLSLAWDAPEALPTLVEISEPERWLKRVA